MADALWYPTVSDILAVHDAIISEYSETAPGVRTRGSIEFSVEFIREGTFALVPETIHGKAFHLLRLLVANHPFVDANKRTALNTVVVFYFLNGYRLEYDDEIKDILKKLSTDDSRVNSERIAEYLKKRATPISLEEEISGWRDDLVHYGIDRLSEDLSDPNG